MQELTLKMKNLKSLFGKVVKENLEALIDEMILTDPRLLCRLNLNNKKVSKIVQQKIEAGLVHPFHLMYDPEETLEFEPSLTVEMYLPVEDIEEIVEEAPMVDLYESSGEWTIEFNPEEDHSDNDALTSSDIGECFV